MAEGYYFDEIAGRASDDTFFVLCNNPGFDVNLSTDTYALGFHYAPFAADNTPGESIFEWTLYDEAGEIIAAGDAAAAGFATGSDQHFFGIVSLQPFRTVKIRRVKADGTEGFGNWMYDDVRWAAEVEQGFSQ